MRPVDETDSARGAVVEVPSVGVGEQQVRSGDHQRHEPDDCDHRQRTTGAQSTTQRMHDHHISAPIQPRSNTHLITYTCVSLTRTPLLI